MTAALGPHAAFIVASYAAAVLIIGGLACSILLDNRAAKRQLAALESERERGR